MHQGTTVGNITYGSIPYAMVDLSLVSADLILLILLLLPGLFGLKLYLYFAGKIDSYSRLDAVAYSVGISILSVLLLYAAYGLHLRQFPASEDVVALFSLPLLIGLYLGHVCTSTLLGGLFGKSIARLTTGERDKNRKEVWDFAFDEIYSDSRIRVMTTSDFQIEGTVVAPGQTVQARDLILASPYRLEDVHDGDGKQAISLGDYVYIHEQDINHIGFFEDLNDDLDVDTLKELGYTPVSPGTKDEGKEPDEQLEEELQRELEEPEGE